MPFFVFDCVCLEKELGDEGNDGLTHVAVPRRLVDEVDACGDKASIASLGGVLGSKARNLLHRLGKHSQHLGNYWREEREEGEDEDMKRTRVGPHASVQESVTERKAERV